MFVSVSLKIMTNFFFDSIGMLRFGETKVAKENFLDVNIDNIVISKLIEIKTNSKYLVGYLDKVMRPLVLILPKMNGYVETFKVKDKHSKLMSFRINHEKLLEKYKTI